jgi:ubiquinone/menaquinone biosynthesis C-methylase UbiE
MPETLATYTHGHHASVVAQHRKRTAAEAAHFLLPHLRPGMRLLDVGCGPGSITVGLAEAVAPGAVLGVDLAANDVLASGRQLALEKGLGNVRFERADLFELRQPGGFDVVFAHQVLQHLARPVEALAAMRRLLSPGGIIAVRDSDYGTSTWSPPDARLQRWLEVYHAVAARNGGEADAGRYLYGWLHEAGFGDVILSGTTWTFPGYDSVEAWATSWAERTTRSNLAVKAVEYGIASGAELESIADGFRQWCRGPAAFFSIGHVEALARVAIPSPEPSPGGRGDPT